MSISSVSRYFILFSKRLINSMSIDRSSQQLVYSVAKNIIISLKKVN
jgi:hypothetical protein